MAQLPPILQSYILASAGDTALLAAAGADADTVAQPTGASGAVSQSNQPAARSDASPAQTTGTGPGTTSAVDQALAQGQRDTYGAQVVGSQYIDLFGYFRAARDVQDALRDFYALDLERTLNETALTAKDAFFNVLFALAEQSVEQEQVNYSTENLRIVTAQRTQGLAADYDVDTARTELANAQEFLTTAQNQVQLATSQLAYLLGISPDQSITLVPPPLPPLSQKLDLNYSIGVATRLRPEIRQAARNVDMADKLVKLAGATLSPTLGLVGVAQYDSVSTIDEPQSFATISAQLGLPIDDGGATRSRVRSAKIAMQTQMTNYAALKLSVGLEVRQAVLDIANAQVEIGSAQVAVQTAEEAVRLADVRYENGLGTFLDVTNALAQLATARNNLADAQFSYQTSLATLVRDEGGR